MLLLFYKKKEKLCDKYVVVVEGNFLDSRMNLQIFQFIKRKKFTIVTC